jgi:hypothetical protein
LVKLILKPEHFDHTGQRIQAFDSKFGGLAAKCTCSLGSKCQKFFRASGNCTTAKSCSLIKIGETYHDFVTNPRLYVQNA